MDANDAASYVQELTGEEANIIFGAMYDDSVTDYARITVIATGLSDMNRTAAGSARQNRFRAGNFTAQGTGTTTGTGKIGSFGTTGTGSIYTPSGSDSQSGTGSFSMPHFNMPNVSTTPFSQKQPSSTVPARDIQIPEFLKKR